MSKGIKRGVRSSKLNRASTWKTWNPSGQELDGTKRIPSIPKTTKGGQRLKSRQQASISSSEHYGHKTEVTLPKFKLPPEYKD